LNCGIGSILERAGESVGKAPHGPCRELRILRLEIEPVDFRQQAAWGVKGAIDKRVVEDQLCALIGDLGLSPQLHLTLQRVKVPLNTVNTDRKRVDQVEALRMLGQNRCKDSTDCPARAFVRLAFVRERRTS